MSPSIVPDSEPGPNETAASNSKDAKTSSQPTFQVPTIDISEYLKNPDSEAAQSIVPIVRAACRTTGFFQVTGHGIPKSLQQAVFAGSKQFFALPIETKKQLHWSKVRGRRGYDMLASQSYGENMLPDLKESFIVGEDVPDEDPRVQAGRHFMGSNVWPDEQLLSAADFREPVEQYHAAVTALSHAVLRIIEDSLPYGRGIFDEFISNNPMTPMRILHYPPSRGPVDEVRQYGASPHTDFGAIATLLQDGSPGLEVYDQPTGAWVPILPAPNAYVINVGDMLSFWTRGEYVSSLHRVINKNEQDRYSIVLLYHGNSDARLLALDGSEDGKENPLTVEQHVLGRLNKSYKKGEKD